MIRLALFALALSFATAARAAEVRIRPECRPAGTVVLLGDVAEIQAADEQQAKKLAALELFPAPGAGQRRHLRLREILEILELRSADLADCRIAGASQVTIHGPASQANPQPAANSGPAPLPNQPPAAPPAKPAAEPVVMAVTAIRPVERGQVIQPDDVQLAAFPARSTNESLLHEIELAVGQEASRSYAPGQPLDARDLRKPLLVRRRDALQVTVVAPGVRLTSAGVAVDEGSLGDWIAIESPYSKERIRARVLGLRQVAVYAGGAAPPAFNP